MTVLARELEEAAGKILTLDSTQRESFIGEIVDKIGDFFGIDLNQIPILGDLITGLDTAFGQVLDLFQGLVITPINGAIAAVKDWFTNFLGFKNTTTTAIEETNSAVLDVETRVVQIQEIFDVVSSRSLADGPDPTGESTFRYEMLTNRGLVGQSAGQGFPSHLHEVGTYRSAPTYIPLTSSMVLFGWIRQGLTLPKSQISWIAYKSGEVYEFNVAIKFMAASGAVTEHAYMPSLGQNLITSSVGQWMQLAFPPFTPEQGDVVGIEFSMSGTGTVFIAGIELMAPLALPGFRPAQPGAVKPTMGRATNYTDAAMLTYASGLTPYVQIGSDVGQIGAKRTFVDNFNRTTGMGPNWILRALGSDTSRRLVIESNKVTTNAISTFETYVDGQWIQPLATDNVAVEATISEMSQSVPSALILCCNGGFTEFVMVTFTQTLLRIYTCPSRRIQDWVLRNETTVSSRTGGRFKFTYNRTTMRYAALIDGVEYAAWADSGDLTQHGDGFRYVGIAVDHLLVTNGGKIDDFKAYDV